MRSVSESPEGFASRKVALAIAVTRVGVGVVALVAPSVMCRLWIGDGAGQPGAKVLTRAVGGRDIALGVGPLIAARRGKPIRAWVEAGALADLIDSAATVKSFSKLPPAGRWLVLGSALCASGSGALASRSL